MESRLHNSIHFPFIRPNYQIAKQFDPYNMLYSSVDNSYMGQYNQLANKHFYNYCLGNNPCENNLSNFYQYSFFYPFVPYPTQQLQVNKNLPQIKLENQQINLIEVSQSYQKITPPLFIEKNQKEQKLEGKKINSKITINSTNHQINQKWAKQQIRKQKVNLYLQKRRNKHQRKWNGYQSRKISARNRIRYHGKFISCEQAVEYLNLDSKINYSIDHLKILFKSHFESNKSI